MVLVRVVVWGHHHTIRELPPCQCLLSFLTIDYWIKLNENLWNKIICVKKLFFRINTYCIHLWVHKKCNFNKQISTNENNECYLMVGKPVNSIYQMYFCWLYLPTSWNIDTLNRSRDFNTTHNSIFRTFFFNIFQDICSRKIWWSIIKNFSLIYAGVFKRKYFRKN